MYIVMELYQQKYKFDNILEIILSINQSTLYEKKIRSNTASSLLEKDLRHFALSLDRCGVPYTPTTSTNKFTCWYQSICCGQRRIVKILRLKKKILTTSVQIKPIMKSQAINDHISIGSAVSPRK